MAASLGGADRCEELQWRAADGATGVQPYGGHNELWRHLTLFIDAQNHGWRLKT
jgi:hypothetical protein